MQEYLKYQRSSFINYFLVLSESSETQTFATLSNMEPSSHSSYYESADSSQFSAYRDMNSLDVSSDSLPDNLSVSPLYSSPHW